MTCMAVANVISAIDKMIQGATTCSGSSCFSERDVISPAVLMLPFKLQQEIVSLQE